MQNPDVGAYRWILVDTGPTRRSDLMNLSLHSAMARRNGKTSIHTSSDAYVAERPRGLPCSGNARRPPSAAFRFQGHQW